MARKKIINSEAYVKDIIDSIVDPLLIIDFENKINLANKAVCFLLGYRENELVGKNLSDILVEKKDSIARGGKLEKIIGTGIICNIELYYKAKNGKEIPILFSSSTIEDEAGKESAIICTAKDITEFRKTEEKLRQAYTVLKNTQDQLIQAEKLHAIGLLASGVAHEVRNPLGIIIQGINYIEKKVSLSDPKVVETLDMMKNSVQRANKIINSLLDFSRAKSLELNPEDINSILVSTLELVKTKSGFENIDIVFDAHNDLPKVLVDKNKLEQVFINILFNSLQAIVGSGKITIRSYVRLIDQADVSRAKANYFEAGGKACMVEIEDTGAGIDRKHLKKIFDPFFTTKGLRGGSGIGLSVCRNIVDMHSGMLYVESQKGKGTKVFIGLKISKSGKVKNGQKENFNNR